MKPENTKKILKQTKDIYNRIASDFSDTRGKWWQGMGDFNKYVKAGDKVLDLGCGNGRMAEIFQNKKVEYLGIDNSEELIRIARERFNDKPWVRFEVGDVLDVISTKSPSCHPDRPASWRGVEGSLGFERDSSASSGLPDSGRNDNTRGEFDLVLMIAVLHHIPSKKLRLQVLKNVYSVLKPGGRLVLVNWNLWQVSGWKKKFRYWQYLWNWPEKIKRGSWGVSDAFVPWKPAGPETRRYIHSFGKSELKRLLKRAGFGLEELDFTIKGGQKAGVFRGDNLLAVAVKK